jgi:hypothetical protein
MYAWKTLRLFCLLLLLLPLVHLVYIMSRDVMAIMDHSPDAFAGDLKAYDRLDNGALPVDPVVVVGGRRVKLWRGLEQALAPRAVLLRGLGDAIVEDITQHYARLIGYYRPRDVVLLTGTSEFFIRDSKSGEQLATAIGDLAALDASHGVTQRFYVVSPLKTPLRRGDDAAIDEAMALLADLAANDPRVVLLNANALLVGPDGLPDPMYFRADGVQLNEHGYLRLTVLLQDNIDTTPGPPEPPPAAHISSNLR